MDTRRAQRARRQLRRRRLFAVLSAGAVLGITITPTLASWTDTEVATGSVGTSTFSVVSRPGTSGTFGNHGTSGTAAVLSFSSSAKLAPGKTVYASLDIRTTTSSEPPATDEAGTVALSATTASGDLLTGGKVNYRVVANSAATAGNLPSCDSTAFSANPASAQPGALPSTVPSAAIAANGGSTARFCVEIALASDAPNSLQGTSSQWSWTFTAQST